LDGVNVASAGLMAGVMLLLARTAYVDIPTILIGVVAALLLLRFKVNATWLIAASAAIGLVLSQLPFRL
jgi:chromate transporter